jgi:hypothetical protein
MRTFLSSTQQDCFKFSRKNSLRLIGSAGLFGGLMVLAVMCFQAPSKALVTEAVPPPPEVVVPSQHIRFTLYRDGIYPPKATVRAGLVSIGIEDLAGANGGLLVERLTGGPRTVVGTVQRLQQYLRGRASVNLAAGTYRLRIVGSQANEAELTVEP